MDSQVLRLTPRQHQNNIENHDVNALANVVDKLKISTLVNAAKISPHVHQRTLGRDVNPSDLKREQNDDESVKVEKSDEVDATKNHNNNNNNTNKKPIIQKSKFRTDVWREVNVNEDTESPRNFLQLNDCKLVSFRLAANSAEKQRRSKISSTLQQQQSKLDSELEQRLQQIRIDSAAEAQQRLQEKRREREQSLQSAIKQIEDEAKVAEEQASREKSQQLERNKKLMEQIKQLQRSGEIRSMLDAINTHKVLIVNLFESLTKQIVASKNILQQHNKLEPFLKRREEIQLRYQKIMGAVNAKQISNAEVNGLEKLAEDIRQEQNHLNVELKNISEIIAAAMAAAESEAKKTAEVEAAQAQNAQQQQVAPVPQSGETVVDGTPASLLSVANECVHPDRLSHYTNIMTFYEQQRAQVQSLLDDINMKKFRFNCQKAVNTPVNAISAVSSAHLLDKFDKLSRLIAGAPVRSGDEQFSASEHPLGVQYCTMLLAKKFVNQASTISTSSNPHAAYPIASVIVSIWQAFPHFGQLFLAMLYKQCPFLVPYFIPKKENQTDQDYLTALGYRFENNKMEPQDQYLKRLSGIQRLHSAILITKQRRDQQHMAHPYALENGWTWFASFLNLDPLPEISATLIYEFLQVCGTEMWQTYKQQFTKLLIVLQQSYMLRLEQIDSGGPNARLKVFIDTIVRESRIQPPSGTLPPNFW